MRVELSWTSLTNLPRPASMATLSLRLVVGDVAQLGERRNGIAEVEGSIPFVSTNRFSGIGSKSKHL